MKNITYTLKESLKEAGKKLGGGAISLIPGVLSYRGGKISQQDKYIDKLKQKLGKEVEEQGFWDRGRINSFYDVATLAIQATLIYFTAKNIGDMSNLSLVEFGALMVWPKAYGYSTQEELIEENDKKIASLEKKLGNPVTGIGKTK